MYGATNIDDLLNNKPCLCLDSYTQGQGRPYLTCDTCALWVVMPEDAYPPEEGICPLRRYPANRTRAEDGCRAGLSAASE